MAKARANAVDVEALVRPLLVAVAAADGEVKLIGAGEPAALLAKKTGPDKPAYDRLTTGDRPLVSVRKDGKAEFARVTAAGFLVALPHLPGDRVGDLAGRLANGLPPSERLEFLQAASRAATDESAALLLTLVDALAAEAEVQAAAAARRRQAEAAVLDRLLALKRADVERLQSDLAAAEAMIARLGGLSSETPPPARGPDRPPAQPDARPGREPLAPTDPEDLPFRRQVLQRLVTSWLEAVDHGRDEGRRYLEAAIHNIRGVRRLGEVDEELLFDGAVHRAARAVADGHVVKVVRPGWALDEDDGRFVIVPAEVA